MWRLSWKPTPASEAQTITQYQTEAFPLVTRNYSDLLALVTGSREAPTAATTTAINSLVRQGAYNINGQRSVFNNFLLDGMDNNAYGESNQGFDNQIIAVPPDSVAQWNVVTNNENAEYGRSSGATVNVASASGTNHFMPPSMSSSATRICSRWQFCCFLSRRRDVRIHSQHLIIPHHHLLRGLLSGC
jgi:TonB-dependent Receptor Plug Domain